jgi:nucleoside phosphorylase
MTDTLVHPYRKEIARYLLSRGLADFGGAEAEDAAIDAEPMRAAPIPFPPGTAPIPAPLDPAPASSAALPRADVVVITWTVDEVAALAQVFTPGVSPKRWYPYDRDFAMYKPNIRPHAPAANSARLGSYFPTMIGTKRVLAMKSELHLNQDGVKTGDGTATLPVRDFFKQIIAEVQPTHILTVGTAGSVFDRFGLGDAVVTRAAKFRCQLEFHNEPFNHHVYKSHWKIPQVHFSKAEELMAAFAEQLAQPPVGPPTKEYDFSGPLLAPPQTTPRIRLDGRDMDEFHPILTTDYFEYGTSANQLDEEGAGVEMGDAALGLACSELQHPPKWAVVRNMSDPVINGDLPAGEFRLNEQTTWAVGYYTAYGRYTSIMSSLASWAIIAGLDQ